MASQAAPGGMMLGGPQTINTAAQEMDGSTNVAVVDGGDNLVAAAHTDGTGLDIIDIARGPGYRPGIFQV